MPNGSNQVAVQPPSTASAEPDRLSLTSADPLTPRYEELKALFPMAVTDGRVDLEKLRAVMGEHAATGPERYGLSWAGKSDALKTLRQQTTATLLPAPSESVNWETTGNAIIEGDNLEVLKVLQNAYHGKVKLIYIDPPYNTGGDFVYPDDYSEGLNSYLQYTRQLNEEGHQLTTNKDKGGRYHSRWLTMMYPRLFLARNLLREDGVIFISIDDHEVHNLRLVLDEIFGEENMQAMIAWKRTVSGAVSSQGFVVSHEYMLCYSRSAACELNRLAVDDADAYKNPDSDPRGPYKLQKLERTLEGDRPSMTFEIQTPQGPLTKTWAVSPKKYAELLSDNRIGFSRTGTPYYKQFLAEYSGRLPVTWWDKHGTNQDGSRELKGLFDGEQLFNNPKPTSLIKEVLKVGSSTDSIILDFFAGSGTAAQAVLEQNREDGGNRKFILVQLPEPTNRTDFPTIAEITKERVRRVIHRMETDDAGHLALADGPKPDLGFKVFKLAPSNFSVWDASLAPQDSSGLGKQWELTADNVRGDASEQALLHELMLKCGLPLASPIRATFAAGLPVFLLDEGRLLICLARELTREALRAMIELKPQSVLCLDVGFKGRDALKVNAQLEFQSHGIQFRTA
jgi:adenine-specific DNA-methyltransferase